MRILASCLQKEERIMAARSTLPAQLPAPMTALIAALMVAVLMLAYQAGRTVTASTSGGTAHSSLDGREVFDADGVTLGVVEQTVSVRQGDRASRYAMVRVSLEGNAGLRLAVPEWRLQAVEDGLLLTSDADYDELEADGDFMPAAADLRTRT
jgi:sporulation protein YlmC with PRC-barrel domain